MLICKGGNKDIYIIIRGRCQCVMLALHYHSGVLASWYVLSCKPSRMRPLLLWRDWCLCNKGAVLYDPGLILLMRNGPLITCIWYMHKYTCNNTRQKKYVYIIIHAMKCKCSFDRMWSVTKVPLNNHGDIYHDAMHIVCINTRNKSDMMISIYSPGRNVHTHFHCWCNAIEHASVQ